MDVSINAVVQIMGFFIFGLIFRIVTIEYEADDQFVYGESVYFLRKEFRYCFGDIPVMALNILVRCWGYSKPSS